MDTNTTIAEPPKQKTISGLIWKHLRQLKKDKKSRSNGQDPMFDLGFNTGVAETSDFLVKLVKEVEKYNFTLKTEEELAALEMEKHKQE